MKKWIEYQRVLFDRAKVDTSRIMEISRRKIVTSVISSIVGGIVYYRLAGVTKLWDEAIAILAFGVCGFLGTFLINTFATKVVKIGI